MNFAELLVGSYKAWVVGSAGSLVTTVNRKASCEKEEGAETAASETKSLRLDGLGRAENVQATGKHVWSQIA